MNIIILISTPDARGLVHKISSNLLEFNIEKNDEFVDKESGQFFMRTEISVDSANSASCGDFSRSRSPRFLDEPSVLSASLASHERENSSTILEFASCQNAESTTNFVESALDSANQNNPSLRANPQDLRGNPPIEKSQNPQRGWLLRNARKFYELPRSHSLARNDEFLDSSPTAQNDNKVDCHADSANLLAMTKNTKNAESALDSANAIKNRLQAILPKNSFLKVTPKRKKSLIIFATKESHCLGDLLLKNYNNELNIEIKAVISNHADLGALVGKFHIPYFHISHERADYENEMLQICANFAPDFIVLAKYMRILRPSFIKHYENRIINIHHSFLPAFIGANPYKQAYNRGVKIIGATAHFVTSELDSGPIICQDILQVNHTFSWQDMQKAGRNIERVVLARAVELAIDERIFIHNNKTIIF